jgi:hypothetical protein
MKKMPGMSAVLSLLVLSASCTSIYQRRGTEEPLAPITVQELEGTGNVNAQLNLESRSIEKFKGTNKAGKQYSFDIGVIEINDEGFTNEAQAKQVLDHVRERLEDGALVVTFVHGWHHGPRICDRDIACFRRVLDRLAANRNSAGPVTGVYIGWRGEAISTPIINGFTFWDRKAKAQHLGRMDGAQVLLTLDGMYHERREKYPEERMVMVTVGHSFGGALVFSAMKQLVTGSVGDILGQNNASPSGTKCGRLSPDDCSYRIVRAEGDRVAAAKEGHKARRARLGDLVVLVNPAIEAMQYQAFDSDLPDSPYSGYLPNDKKLPYLDDQLPVLMTVASQADQAVGRAFPAGRFLSGFMHPKIFVNPALRTGMGHYEPQRTHILDYTDTEHVAALRAAEQKRINDPDHPPACECTMMFDDPDLGIDPRPLSLTETKQEWGKLRFELAPNRDPNRWDRHSPYLVVQATGNVIGAHSDIYNPVFVTFLTKYITAYDTKKTHTTYGPVGAASGK